MGGFIGFIDPFGDVEPGARYDAEPWLSVLIGIGFFIFGGLLILLAQALAKDKDQ